MVVVALIPNIVFCDEEYWNIHFLFAKMNFNLVLKDV